MGRYTRTPGPWARSTVVIVPCPPGILFAWSVVTAPVAAMLTTDALAAPIGLTPAVWVGIGVGVGLIGAGGRQLWRRDVGMNPNETVAARRARGLPPHPYGETDDGRWTPPDDRRDDEPDPLDDDELTGQETTAA